MSGTRSGSPAPVAGGARRARGSSRRPWPGDPGRLALLERELRDRVDGEVRFDAGSRGAYSTDGSDFRQVPLGVVLPRTIEAGVAAVSVCSRHGAPLLSRGGGTSLSGQCTNRAVVIDWSKYCHRLVHVDPEQRRCLVEPGIVLDELNRRLAPHGLRYGPEPASHPNCTIGGMIGNNSCGATAQRMLTQLPVDFRGLLRRRDQGEVPGHPAPRVGVQPGLAAARARLRRGGSARRQRVDAGDRAAR